VGFFADGRLKRVPASGGAAVDIVVTTGFPAGASWGPDDRIVFAYGASARLHTVEARGGHASVLAGVESGYAPEVVPDGRTVLFESSDWIHAFDSVTGRTTRLIEGAAPRYALGHVVLSRGTTLLAAPIDLARHQLTGPAIPLVEGVALEAGGIRHYAISKSGTTLAYAPAADAYALVLVEADGTERRVSEEQLLLENPQFSPDGRSVAVATTRRNGEPPDVWIHELETGAATRLTFDGGRAPVWTPDGTAVTYSHVGKLAGIYMKRADGNGDPSQHLALDSFHWLVGWTPDRRYLAYGVMEGEESSIMAVGDGKPRRVVGPGSMWGGRLSKDGRWLAYYSLQAGNFEVYVTPFPEAGRRWLIADGTDPAWGRDGAEVYYRSGARLMAARIDTTAGVRVLSHRVVIEPFLPPLYDDYDIDLHGRRLVMVRPAGSTHGREVMMVLDWFTELRQLARSSS
jgi:WD40-like Beta Propeller Repeat